MGVWGELGVGEVPNKDQRLQNFPYNSNSGGRGGGLLFSTSEYVSKLRPVYWGIIKNKNKKFPNHELETLI